MRRKRSFANDKRANGPARFRFMHKQVEPNVLLSKTRVKLPASLPVSKGKFISQIIARLLGFSRRRMIESQMDLGKLRQDYRASSLELKNLAIDPIEQFQQWFREVATIPDILEPNAMILSTASLVGEPTSRTVLLKGVDAAGFRFFTNYESAKGNQLATNPQAALLFLWLPLERQVHVQGSVEKLSREESEIYFHSRPRGSQLGAWASHQSTPIADRAVLEAQLSELEKEYADQEIPLPPNWGGYLVRPRTIEFWQGRSDRLHDRLRYTEARPGLWQIDRLSP